MYENVLYFYTLKDNSNSLACNMVVVCVIKETFNQNVK